MIDFGFRVPPPDKPEDSEAEDRALQRAREFCDGKFKVSGVNPETIWRDCRRHLYVVLLFSGALADSATETAVQELMVKVERAQSQYQAFIKRAAARRGVRDDL